MNFVSPKHCNYKEVATDWFVELQRHFHRLQIQLGDVRNRWQELRIMLYLPNSVFLNIKTIIFQPYTSFSDFAEQNVVCSVDDYCAYWNTLSQGKCSFQLILLLKPYWLTIALLPWMGNDVTHSAQCPCQKINENDFFNYSELLSNSLEGLKWITGKKTRCPLDLTCTVSLCQRRDAVKHQSKFSAGLKTRFYYWNSLCYSTDFSGLRMSRRLGEVWL